MNGKFIYFAVAALLGVLGALIHFISFLILTLLFLFALSKYKRFSNPQLIAVAAAFLVFFMAGHNDEATTKSAIPESTTTFYLEYHHDPKIDGDLLQVQAFDKRYKEKLLIRYKIQSEPEKESLKNQNFYGRLCRVSGTMEKPKTAKNPNGFDYRHYLSTKKIFWIAEIQGNPIQNCAPLKESPIVQIKKLRYNGIRYLDRHFPPEIASLSAALVFGDRSMFDPELLSDYQQTGIVHLLAISGLHVSLLIGMVFYLGIRIGITRQSMMNFLLIILPVYVILTGASPSVIRAALMIFLVLAAIKWKRHVKLLPIDAISLAFIFYLFISPMIIFDVGFQLSFAVSLVIILSAGHILAGYRNNGAKMLVTSIISQLSALPFLLYHYFEMSLVGIMANMIYIPLFSFVYLPGLYILFLIDILLGNTPQILIKAFSGLINLSNGIIAYLANFSVSAFIPGRPAILLLIIYILLILTAFSIWEAKSNPKWKSQLCMLTIALFSFQPLVNFLNPFGQVTMIDVGQGDSILIHFPFGKGTYLIDTGGTMHFTEEKWRERARPFEVGRDVVVPFLKGQGITKIDKLILTHGDMEHIGGTFSILEELKVKQILMPSVSEPSDKEQAILQEAKRKNIPVIHVSKGNQWNNGVSTFFILAPEKDFTGERNSGSIVIYALIGGAMWFFGGDLDLEGEEAIIKDYPQLRVDVLKAGHHGSRTSSGEPFIKSIKPGIAFISAGENNRFGHPHQEVLKRFEDVDTSIYRTDLQGAVTYRFFRANGTFSPFLP